MRIIPALFFIAACGHVFSQGMGMVRGNITDAASQAPVSSVTVMISGINTYTAVTDSAGSYEVSVMPGSYSILLQRQGYRSVIRDNIVAVSGKQLVADFEVTEAKVDLAPVSVYPKKENKELELRNLQQYAAVFYDPARMINSRAAAVNTNDQSNNISIHGTSPNYIQWKVEGVEVVNPNHLENSGTLNDRPALNGGGVSILSAQLLQNSDFQFAPFDPLSGNTLSGIFDMRLRKGNEQRPERIVQASFLGTDLSLEGPFSKNSKASYLVNARYSTIGLLSALGVNFGDEKTNYKDVSYVFSFPHKYGSIKLFGMLGNSETIYKGKTDTAQIEVQKELQNIGYSSFTAINGINMVTTLSNTLYLKTVLAYSSKLINRDASPSSAWQVPTETDRYQQSKLSSVVYLSKRLSNSYSVKAGSYLNYFTNDLRSFTDTSIYANGRITQRMLQPFVSLEGTAFKKIEFRIGLHSMYFPEISNFSLQPRAMLKYLFSQDHDLTFSYGKSSQLQPAFLYLSSPENRGLKPTTSETFSMQHRLNLHKVEIRNEIFYQVFQDIPVSPACNFSAFNYFNEQVNFPLGQEGKATVYGYDLTLEKRYQGFYGIVSASLFNSTYTTPIVTHSGRFNTGYNTFITTGKEWTLPGKKSYIALGFRATMRNGFGETSSSGVENQYLYNARLPLYKRMDMRLSYRKDRENSSVIWALDIQNLTNNRNIAYYYYDRITKKTEPQYQLGLIPVLSYKILF